MEKAQNLPLDKVVDIKKHLTLSELIQFFRTNGMCPDPIFKNDVVAHVRGLDRDGFVAFVKQVNATVDAFATPFGYEGDVSASLNRIPVKTRSHAKMTATLLESKLRGRAAFQELQDGGSIKMYETTTPLLRWIVEEFVWFLHEFSIDNCKASDEYVQFARDFYLPDLADGITDLFTMLRLEWYAHACDSLRDGVNQVLTAPYLNFRSGIGPSIGSVGTLADGAGAVAGYVFPLSLGVTIDLTADHLVLFTGLRRRRPSQIKSLLNRLPMLTGDIFTLFQLYRDLKI